MPSLLSKEPKWYFTHCFLLSKTHRRPQCAHAPCLAPEEGVKHGNGAFGVPRMSKDGRNEAGNLRIKGSHVQNAMEKRACLT